MGCPPERKIIHSLKLVDYLHVQADNPWYNYYLELIGPLNVYYIREIHIQPIKALNAFTNHTKRKEAIETVSLLD